MPVKKIIVEKANRLYQLPPDLMSFRRAEKHRPLLKKPEVLNLADFRWSSPPDIALSDDHPLAPAGKEAMQRLKEELAGWYKSVYDARLSPLREVFIGNSISSNMLCLALAFVDHGDIAFVPALGLPLYRKVVTACGGEPVTYSVSSQDDWLPNFERVGTRLGRVARVLFVNSPHNPTGAELGEKDMADLVYLAGKENIMVINDAAYQTVTGRKPASLMSAAGGRKVGVEVGSFAYHFGLPSLPLAFAVGHRDVISGLKQASGLVRPHLSAYQVQAALEAIRQYPNRSLQNVRRLISLAAAEAAVLMDMLKLEKAGFDSVPFAWARLPRRSPSKRAADRLLKRSRILVTPGAAFGDIGEGYLRLSLTAGAETFAQAHKRLRKRRAAKLTEEE